MIYLFNSSYHPTYFENLYRLLGLPECARVDMRYSEDVNAPGSDTDSDIRNSACVVCFVDRFSNDYVYYPCRKGRIRSINRVHKRVFYNIELGEYCHSERPKEFTGRLQNEVSQSPRLTNDDRECGEDGLYCVSGPELSGLVISTAESWSRVVDQIYDTKTFENTVPAFFQVVLDRKGSKPKGSDGGLELHANTKYDLTVFYRIAKNRLGHVKRYIQIKRGDEIDRVLNVGSVMDRVTIPMILPPLDFSAGALTIETIVESSESNGGVTHYTANIPIRTHSLRVNAVLFILIFLAIFVDEFWQVGWCLTDIHAWRGTITEFIKFAIVIWAIYRFRGLMKISGL